MTNCKDCQKAGKGAMCAKCWISKVSIKRAKKW